MIFFHHFVLFTIDGVSHFFFTLSLDFRLRSSFSLAKFSRPNSLFPFSSLHHQVHTPSQAVA